jgi:S-formylglutathione hydrolase FrmB
MDDAARSAASEIARTTARDPRLDVFRGLGMFIILIAHIPNNVFASWIPARFGFSDATEIFVFCSGVASAYAFGTIYDRHGWLWGTRRILRRLWEVYRGHVGVFIAIVAVLGAIDASVPQADYLRGTLNLGYFLDSPAPLLGHFLTLTYVPNYFDILPMYLVILALVPLMMAIAGWSRRAVAVTSFAMWLGATLHILDLPAEPWSDRPWFFSPFAWQAIFFTGFAFARGWLPAPPRDKRLVLASVVALAISAPVSCHPGFSCYAGWGYVPALGEAHEHLDFLIDKTHLGALRYVHFLAVSYIAFYLAGPRGIALQKPAWHRVAQVGQQTLAVFLSGMVIAQLLGVALDYVTFPGASLLANVVGCLLLYGVARAVSYWKASPPKDGRRMHRPLALAISACATVLGLVASVKASEIQTLQVPSPALGRNLATSIYVPDGKGPWPVLYLLHGTNGNERDWPVMGHVQASADALIAEGVVPPALIVMPDGGNSWYVDNPDPGGAGLMGTALTHDLLTYIDAHFPTRSCRDGRAIGGASMGGYGAMLHAMDHPDLYGAAFGLSAALWRPWPDDPDGRARRPTRMFRGAYGDPLDPSRFNAMNIFPRIAHYAEDPKRAAMRLAVADHDFGSLRDANIAFVQQAETLGLKIPLTVDPGGHEWSLWAQQFPKMLAWLGGRWTDSCRGV